MKAIDAINLALNLIAQGQRISLLVSKAQAEGRSQLKPEEVKAIHEDRDAAFNRLDQAIAEAESRGSSNNQRSSGTGGQSASSGARAASGSSRAGESPDDAGRGGKESDKTGDKTGSPGGL